MKREAERCIVRGSCFAMSTSRILLRKRGWLGVSWTMRGYFDLVCRLHGDLRLSAKSPDTYREVSIVVVCGSPELTA